MSKRKAESAKKPPTEPAKKPAAESSEAPETEANADGETEGASDTERPPPPVKIEPYMTNLRCKLTVEQVADYADRAATLLADRDSKEDDQKARAKQAKSELEAIEAELRRVSNIVRTKAIYEDIQCERRFVYETKKVQEWRLDTGEMISERDMNAHETQMGLGFNDKPTAAPSDDEPDLDDEFGGEAAE
jgi:hypothetical protein